MEKFSALPPFLPDTQSAPTPSAADLSENTPYIAKESGVSETSRTQAEDTADGAQAKTTPPHGGSPMSKSPVPMLKILFSHESAVRRITKR